MSEQETHVTATLPVSWTRDGFTLTPSSSWTRVDDPEESEPGDVAGGTPRDSMLWGSVELSWAL